MRQSGKGREVVAKGVLSFDLAPDGSVFYSNGSSIHRLAPTAERSERVHVGTMIEQIAAL